MVSSVPELNSGYAAKCTRCESIIHSEKKCDPATLLALSISALILLVPAFTFPLISVHLLGITEGSDLIQGALMMIDIAPLVSFVVIFCAVIAPSLLTLCIAIASACLLFNVYPKWLGYVLKVTQWLIHWSMLEVYMMSLMVAIFKLMAYADLFFGSGMYFFVALLIINMTMISQYNNYYFWSRYLDAQ